MALLVDTIILCVTDHYAIHSILYDSAGMLEGLKKGSTLTLINHSTVSQAGLKNLIADTEDKGICWVDAPVTGGPSGVKQGSLVIFCGTDDDTFKRSKIIMQSYAHKDNIHCLGSVGAGTAAKTCNQAMLFITIYGAYAMIGQAQSLEIDINPVFKARFHIPVIARTKDEAIQEAVITRSRYQSPKIIIALDCRAHSVGSQ